MSSRIPESARSQIEGPPSLIAPSYQFSQGQFRAIDHGIVQALLCEPFTIVLGTKHTFLQRPGIRLGPGVDHERKELGSVWIKAFGQCQRLAKRLASFAGAAIHETTIGQYPCLPGIFAETVELFDLDPFLRGLWHHLIAALKPNAEQSQPSPPEPGQHVIAYIG